jgi:GNAT superfamily N-acetyltransferase
MRAILHPTALPPDYPGDLAHDLVLEDGTMVHVRPIVPDDAAVLADEILTADSETLYLRFFTSAVRPDRAMLDRLTVMDYRTALAVGAIEIATGTSLGIARYAEVDPSTVEVAVSVKPDWRTRGIAGHLLDVVEIAARERGYEACLAIYLMENDAAARLFARRGYHVRSTDRGIVEAALDLTGAPTAA